MDRKEVDVEALWNKSRGLRVDGVWPNACIGSNVNDDESVEVSDGARKGRRYDASLVAAVRCILPRR